MRCCRNMVIKKENDSSETSPTLLTQTFKSTPTRESARSSTVREKVEITVTVFGNAINR